MYKLFIVFFLFFSLSLFSQKQQQKLLNNLENSFSLLSKKDVKYNLIYQKDKETLYLTEIKNNSEFKGYKLLINDIHPLGVYLDEKNTYYSLKVLSKNNGNVFVKETKTLSTVNYLEFGDWNENYKEKLQIFINDLKQFIDFKIKKNTAKTDSDNFKIITKKNNSLVLKMVDTFYRFSISKLITYFLFYFHFSLICFAMMKRNTALLRSNCMRNNHSPL